MGGDSGGGQPTQQNVTTTTSNLPEYARPYFENVVGRAQAESYRPYQAYEDQRQAGFTPEQKAVQQETLGLQTPGQFGQATNFATAAGLGSLEASKYNAGQFGAQQVGQPNLNYYQMEGPQAFGAEQAQQYMSPYVQNVLDVQKREALQDAQKSQLVQNLGAARQGTYGGARQLLAGTERERALGQQMGDIQAKGLQAAYENAQAQFERDRAARMGIGRTNLEAALGVQDLGTKTGLQALLANQQYDFEAQKSAEQSRQFGADVGLKGMAQVLESGRTLGNLGLTEQQADMQRLQTQAGVAGQQQALEQQRLDQQYADFLRQRDYPMEQLGYFSNILRGLPVGLSTTSTAYAPPPSVASQIAGAGLGAASLYKMATG
jgi:hypothetical protein